MRKNDARAAKRLALLLLYCCFTSSLLLLYCGDGTDAMWSTRALSAGRAERAKAEEKGDICLFRKRALLRTIYQRNAALPIDMSFQCTQQWLCLQEKGNFTLHRVSSHKTS